MKRFSLAILALVVATGAQAASEKVEMNLVTSQGVGQSIGSVTITETTCSIEPAFNSSATTASSSRSCWMARSTNYNNCVFVRWRG
ncbi:hypothetical protein ACUOFC_13300, partial [Escherichia sp. TWPC-MK]